jgi:hypothetical protein
MPVCATLTPLIDLQRLRSEEIEMDHMAMWRAHEKTIDARQRAAEIRQGRAVRTPGLRGLVHRIRAGR